MNDVGIGIIGLGNMGSYYADVLVGNKLEHARLTAVCDSAPARLDRWREHAATFENPDQFFQTGKFDAVIIATPHYAHTTLGIQALNAGFHVLVDKPVSVHKADVLKLLSAHANKKQIFAAMFNQRTDPYFLKIKEMIDHGSLGKIRRVTWIITNWFRSETYYASSDWRATWRGEGGGVLLNQCPHQLDMLCWLLGLPSRVNADCRLGKYHDIEVEDEVTARLEYDNGSSGVFITSTGEAPGTNRLEIAGDNGKLVYEQDCITFIRNLVPMNEFSRTTPELFATPPSQIETFSGWSHGDQHLGVMRNFIAAIRDGVPLIAPAQEGLASVELANAMLMSALEKRTVEIPIDGDHYAGLLTNLIAQSKMDIKNQASGTPSDLSGSFR
ncbi:MAG TPA: Gfo/Idh/MocA family oxidoreductase [Kiritimatiellia bacterium]|nr:Gfo/Idh/MocA family oxidoreductase [Kiritimatiellia bacterium]